MHQFLGSIGRVAAHHTPGVCNVKCKLWCKCSASIPLVRGAARARRVAEPGDYATDGRLTRMKADSARGMPALEIDSAKKHSQIRSAPNSRELWDARTALPQVCSRKRYDRLKNVYIPPSCQFCSTNRPYAGPRGMANHRPRGRSPSPSKPPWLLP